MKSVPVPPSPFPLKSPRPWTGAGAGAAAGLLVLLLAGPGDAPLAERPVSADAGAAKQTQKGAASDQTPGTPGRAKRALVTMRGEIVDYYCFIEKGARGESHKECGVRCVAGDICMGLFTDDERLYMISTNHLRAMEPLAFRDIPDPFTKCRGMIAQTVELTGYAMERYGQRVIEVMDVKPAGAKPAEVKPTAESTARPAAGAPRSESR